jgi:hypothetical protein
VRRYVWAGILVFAAIGLVGALQLRASADPTPHELHALQGLTGQRQPIEFLVDPDGQPRSFSIEIYNQCPDDEWRTRWSPADGHPVQFEIRGRRLVPFRLREGRLLVREAGDFSYDRGRRGTGTMIMRARVTDSGVEGYIRSVWRFEREGEAYTACDSGNVPFAAGPRHIERLTLVPRAHEPWSLYPAAPIVSSPRSVDRFAARVDRACGGTYAGLQRWRRYAARQVGRRPDRAALLRSLYVRGHAAQLETLVRLGPPPAARGTYERWLLNFRRRLEVERHQVLAMERGELAAAARDAATLAVMKARGNAIGLAFGLVTCTSNGPTGAANVY